MNATLPSKKLQQSLVKHHCANIDSLDFFDLLTDPELVEQLEAMLPEHRERLFPPTETLSLFLTQVMNADQSCQEIINQTALRRSILGLPGCSTNSGGYCRARKRLPIGMVQHLTRYIGNKVSRQIPNAWRWRGRRVLLVDGTTASMPDTPENQRVFPQQTSQLPGLGFPISRLVGMTCLGSGAVVNAAIGRYSGKGGSERALLRSMQDSLQPGEVLLGDALYATYFFMAEMIERGVDVLFEQDSSRRRVTDFQKGRRLGNNDHVVRFTKPVKKPDWMSEEDYANAADHITMRECKAAGRILVTTMCKASLSKKALGKLYKRRWDVELDIRNIKTTMGMDILRAKSPEMVMKEIWVTLLAYNLVRLAIAQSAAMAGVLPRSLSFKHCLQLWRTWCQQSHFTNYTNQDYDHLFKCMVQKRVGKRPGRNEPRAKKRRPKKHPLMTKPRAEARQEVLDFGHPKRLK